MRALIVAIGLVLATGPAAAKGAWVTTQAGCELWNDSPKPAESFTWTGACAAGRVSGEGTLVWTYVEDGRRQTGRYQGGYRDGRPHGHGVQGWPGGDHYEGEFANGEFNGHGMQVWARGDSYEGEYRDGLFHGHGTYIWASGARYDGEWRFDKRNGQGTHVWATGSRYEGGWLDDRRDGYGVFVSATGDRYEGGHENGLAHGTGKCTTGGESFPCTFEHGERVDP